MPEANLFLDKRLHPRVAVRIPVMYHLMDDHKEIKSVRDLGMRSKSSQTIDTSLGGMYIVAESSLNPGEILSLKFSIPGRTSLFTAFAEVAWSNDTGAGLSFLAMKEEDEVVLDSYLKSVSAKE